MSNSRRDFIKKATILSIATPLGVRASNPVQKKVRFGLATDSHYADRDPAGTRYYRQSTDKLKEFTEVMNKEKVDFVIHLGDFKDEDSGRKELDTLHYLNEIEEVFSQFEGKTFHCVGNHDVDSITKKQFLENITNSGISKEKSYYSFDVNGIHFVVLDANFDAEGNDHFFKEGGDWQDTNITTPQLNWLKEDLKTTPFPTVVFCHHPLFKYPSKKYKYHINNYEEVQRILEDSGKVLGVFQGHVHDEKFVEQKGIHYITQFGMVDYSGLENNCFSLVEIDEKEIRIHGYKRSTSRQLKTM